MVKLQDFFNFDAGKTKFAESNKSEILSPIDVSEDDKPSVNTSVDCYVSGQYVDSNGRITTIKQRYSIDITYSRASFRQVLTLLRQRIIQDFEKRYGDQGFSVTDVFIPDLIIPRDSPALKMFKGSDAWRVLTRKQILDQNLSKEKQISQSRVRNVLRRFKVRQDG